MPGSRLDAFRLPHPAFRTRHSPPSAFRGSKPGDEREVAGVKLCWCPPGKFIMGSPPDRARTSPG